MSGNELKNLQHEVSQVNQKLDRIIKWAEGDDKLGTPSIGALIQQQGQELSSIKKISFENRKNIELMSKDIDSHSKDIKTNSDNIKNQNQNTSIIGAGTGSISAIVIHLLKGWLGING